MQDSANEQDSKPEKPQSDESNTNNKAKNESKVPAKDEMDAESMDDAPKTQVYTRRWPILLIFCALSLSNAYQWIHMNIVFDVILAHYNESLPSSPTQANLAIDWLSMIYMLAYFLLMLPAAWILERFGLRISVICAATLNFAGAIIKCFASSPSTFWLLFIGQTICASAQSFILGFPAPLAATWFGVDQLSTATAFGVFGNQIGVAMGFVVPPQFVTLGPNMGHQLLAMYIGGACVTGALLVLVLFMFQDKPPLPPSIGQLAIRDGQKNDEDKGSMDSYLASLKRLMTNPNFVMLAVSYGINTGTFYALSTLLYPIVVPTFHREPAGNQLNGNSTVPDANAEYNAEIGKHIGWAAFTMVLGGVVGSLLAGFVLDKTKQFKLTTLAIYVLSCVSTVLFTATLPLARMWIVYLSMLLLGFFMTGYLPVGFEFAAEITYPENEGLSSGILNAAAQIMGIAFTLSVRAVVDNVSTLAGNLIFSGLLVGGSIMTALIKSDLRRQRANETVTDDPAASNDTVYTTAKK